MDGHSRKARISESGGVAMAKIVFLDDAEQENHEHEARADDAAEIFRLAEQLSDSELERMAKAIAKISQQKPQNSRKS